MLIRLQVIAGLLYVELVLDVSAASLDTKGLLANDGGVVKIGTLKTYERFHRAHCTTANIGDIILGGDRANSVSNPMRCLVLDLMEPGTFELNPQSSTLRRPDVWKTQIKDFWSEACKGPLKALESVSGSRTMAQSNN